MAANTAPRLAIGVTGHRAERLGAARLADIGSQVAQIFAMIAQIVTPGEAKGPGAIRLVSSLADGGDTIAAEQALALGWGLQAVLPFARATYRADFPDPASAAHYDHLLERAEAVLELPAQLAPETLARCYERAGRVMLDQCDVLLALWDHGPVRGRGGTAQIVAEAVARGIPVIQIDPSGATPPCLLWDGLLDHHLGQQTVETVPSAPLDALPQLIAAIIASPAAPDPANSRRQGAGRWMALAWPLLLAATGVRRPHRTDFRAPDARTAASSVSASASRLTGATGRFGQMLAALLIPRFAKADTVATTMAQKFRSGYVANFLLSASAVLLTLASLVLPIHAKPGLLLGELAVILAILTLTSAGNRRGWHRHWMEQRQLAEGLRSLALSAQLGDLGLERSGAEARSPDWVRASLRQTALALGLPGAVIDEGYLGHVRSGLADAIAAQQAHFTIEHRRMHRLEHRLHLLGTLLFALTALICVGSLGFEGVLALGHYTPGEAAMHRFATGVTMATAGLPALGAAIYGIRMQGEFATVAKRAADLADRLAALQATLADDPLDFDTLRRRIALFTSLLAGDMARWHQTYSARPLVLPG